MKEKDSNFSVIDFFCGAGGFSEGFRQQGFDIIRGYDNWKPAIDTYNHNFGTKSVVFNILDFGKSTDLIDEVPNTDVIVGSPPCVSFSSSNKSGKADKSLGLELTKCFLRVVAVKKHQKGSILKAWYMENVVNSKKYVSNIYSFEDLGLSDWAKNNNINPKSEALNLKNNTEVLNSADYGSFQARKRAISGEIIKHKKIIVPPHSHGQEADGKLKAWKNLGHLLKNMPSPKEKKSNKEISDPVYPQLKIPLSQLSDHFYDSGLYRSEWKQAKELKTNHYCMGKMSFPENLEKPSRTITATKSGTSREALIYPSEFKREGNGEFRTPTIREAASIMGFPFTYQFKGALNSKWRLVGNAVCPSVSGALAKEVLKAHNRYDVKKELVIKTEVNLDGIQNLNNPEEKSFDKQPRRSKNSRFRRHPIKVGNMTVTLSNYNIGRNSKPDSKWYTSIQYGTGANFINQEFDDFFYEKLGPIIDQTESGAKFIKIINNGFSEIIASSEKLQEMYEAQISQDEFLEPTEIIHKLSEMIECKSSN